MSILRRHRDERAAESVAMLFVIPVLVVLVLALIDVGMMFRARMLIENVARDAVRGVAADGGNFNPHTNLIGMSWDDWAMDRLVKNEKCLIAACKPGELPTLSCDRMQAPGSNEVFQSQVVPEAGYTVICRGHYPYQPINKALLSGPLGLGMGSLLKEFDIEVAARAETGENPSFGVG